MDITKKIHEIYGKIAVWHNGDEDEPNKTNLLGLSQEIVEDMINFTIQELDVKTRSGVEVSEEGKKELLKKMLDEKPKKKGLFSWLKK